VSAKSASCATQFGHASTRHRLPSTFLQCYSIAALSIATSHALHPQVSPFSPNIAVTPENDEVWITTRISRQWCVDISWLVLIPGVVADCNVGGCTCAVYVGGGCSGVVTVVWRVVVLVAEGSLAQDTSIKTKTETAKPSMIALFIF
jgi:hypothetical protein